MKVLIPEVLANFKAQEPDGFNQIVQYLTVASLISDEQDAQYFVYPGETVRFHLLNMAADSWIHLWIENHTMTVIEVDGVYVEPYESQGVDIAIGQRYSVLVTMDANSSFNYPIVASLDPSAGSIRPNTTAWLVYDPLAPLPSAQIIPAYYPFEDTDIHTLEPHAVDTSSTRIQLNVSFGGGGAEVNGVTYEAPLTPTLFTVLGATDPYDPSNYPTTSNAYILQYNISYWVIVQNNSPVNHPSNPHFRKWLTKVHIHGHTPEIIYRSAPKETYDPSATYPYIENAVQRDVILVFAGGFAIFQFTSDNPGTWFWYIRGVLC
jgi:iron transport multicopper oxidase